MMAGIFVYSDIVSLSGELIALVRGMGQSAYAVAINEADGAELVRYGADKVYVLKGDSQRPEDYSRAIAGFIQDKETVAFLVGSTVRGRDLAAQVAAHMRCGLVNDAMQLEFVEGKLQTTKMMYGGATNLTELLSGFQVVTITSGKAQAVKGGEETGVIETVNVQADSRVIVLGIENIVRQGTDISEAKRLISVGMGFNSKDDLAIAKKLADAMDAEIGCTRPIAEDKEWMPTENYIGISGKIVRPELFLALGVSGQIQHVYGIRDSKIIVGVNNNEKAPIFQVSDYGIVGDLYEIAPLLTEAVKNA